MSTRPDPWLNARITAYVMAGWNTLWHLAPAALFTIRLEPSRIRAIWVWQIYGTLLLLAMMFVAEHWIRRAWRRWQTGS
jgi:hypothetical protein